MPAKDIYHNMVVNALQKEGWVITDDPLKLKWGLRELFVDLGATKPGLTLATILQRLGLLPYVAMTIVTLPVRKSYKLIVPGFHPPELRKYVEYAVG
ncbi:XisH protein [Calothrix parasitica NIES-267]|uniref:XisH protein n=1 Tax=Calothrix parasitica NIES-267 TaxID=1973488 RepID=A0A1Z4LKS4_9CYAN|nr:XisH protein [Calothrix parasitica NIES-267]